MTTAPPFLRHGHTLTHVYAKSKIKFSYFLRALSVNISVMDILQIAIEAEKGKTNLANALEVSPANVSNWLRRGMPHMVSRAIKEKYSLQISRAIKAEQAAKK